MIFHVAYVIHEPCPPPNGMRSVTLYGKYIGGAKRVDGKWVAHTVSAGPLATLFATISEAAEALCEAEANAPSNLPDARDRANWYLSPEARRGIESTAAKSRRVASDFRYEHDAATPWLSAADYHAGIIRTWRQQMRESAKEHTA